MGLLVLVPVDPVSTVPVVGVGVLDEAVSSISPVTVVACTPNVAASKASVRKIVIIWCRSSVDRDSRAFIAIGLVFNMLTGLGFHGGEVNPPSYDMLPLSSLENVWVWILVNRANF